MRYSKSRSAAIMLGIAILTFCGSAEPGRADKLKHTTAVFAGLDKITGRIISFEVAINETVQFGTLQITPRVCYSRPPTEAPRTDGFVEVYDIDANKKFNKIFGGWMFVDSPGLNAVEHPIYDVWLTDCGGGTQLIPSSPDVAEDQDQGSPPAAVPVQPASAPAAAPPQPRRPSGATTDSAVAVPPLGPPVYVPSAPDAVSVIQSAPQTPAGPGRPAAAPLPPGPRPPGTIPNPGNQQRYYRPDPDNPYN
jgi:hypothetical protein